MPTQTQTTTTSSTRPDSSATAPIERTFLGWDEPALNAAAARLIEHYALADPGGARLDHVIAVLPGARAGRRLIELLLERADQRRVRLVPPRVIQVGALPELLYEPPTPLAEPALTRRVWAQTLRSLEAETIEALFPYPPEPDDLVGWDTLARIVETLHREVSGTGLRFDGVAGHCADGLLHDDGERWRILGRVHATYLERLRELGFTDRHEARIEAAEAGTVATNHDLWLIGVVELATITRRILTTLTYERDGGTTHALVHAPPEAEAMFDAFGCVRPEAWTNIVVPLDDEQLTFAERPADQARATLDAIAELDGRFAADEVTIGVPDDEVVPYLEQRLAAAGAAARYAAGTPVTQTPPYRLLAAVADYLDGRRFDALATLLRHPDIVRWLERRTRTADQDTESADLFEPVQIPGPSVGAADLDLASTDALTIADRYFGEALPAQVDRALAPTARHGAPLAGVISALDDETFLGTLGGRRRLAEWAPRILALIVDVYGERPLDTVVPDERRVVEASETIWSAAAALHRLPEAIDEPCSAVQAIRLLLSVIEGEHHAPDAEQSAVELLGWLELHLDDAPALIITGANEPHLPESVTADAFLPNALRSRIGLVDNEHRYARDAYQLTAISHSRPYVHLIAGRTSAAGDPLHPSRLLLAAKPKTIAERILRFYAEDEEGRQADGGILPTPDGTGEAEATGVPHASGTFSLPPEPVLELPEPPTRLRVTDFRAVLRDPYRFVLERIYGLEPLDDAAAELDGLRFGSLAHAVLDAFAFSEARAEADAERLAVWFDDQLDRRAREWFGTRPLPTVRIQIEQLRARLRAFAEWQAHRTETGWQIVGAEVAPPGGGIDFDVDGEPIHIRGRIDRVDHHPEEGAWVVFDYKTSDTGKSPEETHRTGPRDAKVWADLQLPLYRHLAAALETPEGEPLIPRSALHELELGYILLPRDLEEVGATLAEWTDEELDQADNAARAVVRILRDGHVDFDPERAASNTYPDDPLAPLLGLGQLTAMGDDAEGDSA